MKKYLFVLIFFLSSLPLLSHGEQHDVTIVNVVIPVRVFDGNTFIDNLKIDDFELYEDGVIQKIEALYLADKTHISRSEEVRSFTPQVARHFYLLFQLTDYDARLAEAMDYLFTEVLVPGDTLTIMTPLKPYSLSPQALKAKSAAAISKEMQKLVRKDTQLGSSTYKGVIRDLQRLIGSMAASVGVSGVVREEEEDAMEGSGSSLEFLLPRYRATLEKMEELRMVDQNRFLQFAKSLKQLEGQKSIVFFYQKEYRPEINQSTLSKIMSEFQDNPNIIGDMQDLFQFYHRYSKMNEEAIKQAFADASLLFNFIFLDKERESVSGVYMREQSEDLFKAFSEVAKATGGLVDTTQNPLAALKQALTASQSCYLLYYSPAVYKKDGKFKKVTVKVKGKDYTVKYRLGYYAE